jgi:hypothetical protein
MSTTDLPSLPETPAGAADVRAPAFPLATGSGCTYGQSYFWTRPDGATMTGFTYGHPTQAAALADIRDLLLPMGWTPPRWWQISRWSDVPRSFPNNPVRDGASRSL